MYDRSILTRLRVPENRQLTCENSAKAARDLRLIRDRGTLVQLIRYGIAGVITATVYSSVYLTLVSAMFPGGKSVMAVPFAFVTALILGFHLHSRWSFAGHGTRENSGRQHGKFLAVHAAGFALNMVFTWVLTAHLGAPTWSPLIPAVTIVPLASFLLQRQWVFA
jgi:putative flippase GtrA